jgi:hypothetical protein
VPDDLIAVSFGRVARISKMSVVTMNVLKVESDTSQVAAVSDYL